MRYLSEIYHESIKYVPKAKPSLSLQWECQVMPDRRYLGMDRIDLHREEVPCFGYVSGDDLKPVGVYVVAHGRKIPDGVYAYDAAGRSAAPDVVGQLVRLGNKDKAKTLAKAFPDREFVSQTPLLYIFTGVLERAVWRFRESAYAQVMQDVGACVGSVLLHAKSHGSKVFALGGFVDDEVAVALGLPATEFPMAALAVFPEYCEVAYNSVDEGVGETAYSNRCESEIMPDASLDEIPDRYSSLFMRQNRGENILDLSKCIRVRRLAAQAQPGDELPITPAKFDNEMYLKWISDLGKVPVNRHPFKKVGMDLDDFSSMLRWLEVGQINLFGAGLLKIWIISFDVMFVYAGVYRYIPVRKSIYMQSGAINVKKFAKCHVVPEEAENTGFAVILTADLNESCNLLGERAYRYMQMNAGYIVQSLHLSSSMVRKTAVAEHFFYHDELKKLCNIPESESIVAEILVGRN